MAGLELVLNVRADAQFNLTSSTYECKDMNVVSSAWTQHVGIYSYKSLLFQIQGFQLKKSQASLLPKEIEALGEEE